MAVPQVESLHTEAGSLPDHWHFVCMQLEPRPTCALCARCVAAPCKQSGACQASCTPPFSQACVFPWRVACLSQTDKLTESAFACLLIKLQAGHASASGTECTGEPSSAWQLPGQLQPDVHSIRA